MDMLCSAVFAADHTLLQSEFEEKVDALKALAGTSFPGSAPQGVRERTVENVLTCSEPMSKWVRRTIAEWFSEFA
ncbi:unnamed protein product [Ectocarpus sp. CCAP 1310/34]|nr:unnamed protein product [Ectocarpus sp. CCAP 1310/34]